LPTRSHIFNCIRTSYRIQHVDKQFVEIDIEDESSLEEWSKKFNVSKATLQYRIRNP